MPHEKSMDTYELAAWRDALSMADHLAGAFADANGLSLRDIRRLYETAPSDWVEDIDQTHSHVIAEYVRRSERQRPAYFRKVTATLDLQGQIAFLVLCLLAAVRANALLDLRDNYRMLLVPGSGNRVTVAGAYAFLMEAYKLIDYSWPDGVFEAIGIYAADHEDEDEGQGE